RPGADPRGVGFFGISKGGSAGLLAAADDPFVRCCVTDGAFATHTTMLPYMRRWFAIYNNRTWLHSVLPDWLYGLFARATLRQVRRETGLDFPHLEAALPRLAPRPPLRVPGGGGTLITPEMARARVGKAGP